MIDRNPRVLVDAYGRCVRAYGWMAFFVLGFRELCEDSVMGVVPYA
jgi:hypothetical protein